MVVVLAAGRRADEQREELFGLTTGALIRDYRNVSKRERRRLRSTIPRFFLVDQIQKYVSSLEKKASALKYIAVKFPLATQVLSSETGLLNAFPSLFNYQQFIVLAQCKKTQNYKIIYGAWPWPARWMSSAAVVAKLTSCRTRNRRLRAACSSHNVSWCSKV